MSVRERYLLVVIGRRGTENIVRFRRLSKGIGMVLGKVFGGIQ